MLETKDEYKQKRESFSDQHQIYENTNMHFYELQQEQMRLKRKLLVIRNQSPSTNTEKSS